MIIQQLQKTSKRIFNLIYGANIRKMSTVTRQVVVDCDPGTDDAQAIMMLLAQSHVDLKAITTVFGNSSLNNSSQNALRTLKVCNRLNVPVYAGADRSLTGRPPVGDAFHGGDGLGDVPDPDLPSLDLVQPEKAPLALTHLAKDMPGELTLVTIGPLTNVAVALRLDQSLGSKYRDLIIMGGNTQGKGNITKAAEFNFYSDPEGAKVVLEEWGGPITWVSMDICDETSFSWDWYDKMVSMDTVKAQFFKAIEAKWTSKFRTTSPTHKMWDQLAAAIAIDNSVVMETQDVYTTVETSGRETLGQSIIDWDKRDGRKPNVKLVKKVNLDLYQNFLLKSVS